jgi:hypothetical protein
MNLQDILDPCSFPLLTSLSHCCEWIGRSSICLPFLPTSDLICLVFNCSLSLFCLLIFFLPYKVFLDGLIFRTRSYLLNPHVANPL